MNNYELALAISAKIEDTARAEVLEKAKGYIARYEGNIIGIEEWGKKRLAYEIKHQNEAFFYFVHFEAEAATPGQLEQEMRIMDHVLRYLIVAEDEYVPVEAPVEEESEAEEIPAAEEAPAEAAEAAAEELEAPEAPAEEAAEEEPEAAEEPAEEAAAEEAPTEEDKEQPEEPAAEEE